MLSVLYYALLKHTASGHNEDCVIDQAIDRLEGVNSALAEVSIKTQIASLEATVRVKLFCLICSRAIYTSCLSVREAAFQGGPKRLRPLRVCASMVASVHTTGADTDTRSSDILIFFGLCWSQLSHVTGFAL